MKTKIKQISIAVITIVMLVGVIQVNSPKASEVVPVDGCEFTGNPNQYCSKNGDALQVYNCVNNFSVTSCGVNVPVTPQPGL